MAFSRIKLFFTLVRARYYRFTSTYYAFTGRCYWFLYTHVMVRRALNNDLTPKENIRLAEQNWELATRYCKSSIFQYKYKHYLRLAKIYQDKVDNTDPPGKDPANIMPVPKDPIFTKAVGKNMW